MCCELTECRNRLVLQCDGYMKHFFRVVILCFFFVPSVYAQINTERMMAIGRNALYFEDYVLSIQYFNQVVKSKPHLAEPFYFRAVAKLYLDDYAGSEEDCSQALERNNFIVRAYVCRSFARMKLGMFDGAVADCDKGMEFDPENKDLLYYKCLSLVDAKRYPEAEINLNEMIRRYPSEVDGYLVRGQMNVEKGDTLAAIDDFSRSISVNKHYAWGWGARGWIYLMKENWANAVADLNEAIRLNPDKSDYFMERGMARFYMNDLRGSLQDLDRSIEIEPNDKLNYLNRAIIRSNVGDLNRALADFDKAILLDPQDYQAMYNRALVRTDVGDLKAAAEDFTSIINKYPKFTPAYRLRSDVRKKMGDAKGADRDFFAAWNIEEKAKEEKASGKKNRKSTADAAPADSAQEAMFDIKKYNRMVMGLGLNKGTDKYQNPMRGRVQDKDAEIQMESLYNLSFYEKSKPGPSRRLMDLSKYVAPFTTGANSLQKLLVTNRELALSSKQADEHFVSIDNYSQRIGQAPDDAGLFFARSIDFALVQDLTNAMEDLNRAIELKGDFLLAYFERANLRFRKMNVEYANRITEEEFTKAAIKNSQHKAVNEEIKTKTGSFSIGEKAYGTDYEMVLRDLEKVLELDPHFLYAYYNRGNMRCLQRDYRSALIDYTKALEINPEFAEAWFNRGLTQIYLGDREHGLADLRMAGQLGLYQAYNIIKRFGD
jgi:tetratricopeptide (TPR) repeat protein